MFGLYVAVHMHFWYTCMYTSVYALYEQWWLQVYMLQCICTFGVHACAPVYMHVHQEVGAHACTLVYMHFMNNSGYKCIYTSVYANIGIHKS